MFKSEQFKEIWQHWKNHKAEKTSYPYTKTAEQMALSALFKKSHGVEDLAIASINWSIEKNWADIYIKPKENEAEAQYTNGKGTGFRESVQDELNRRYGSGG